MNDQPFRTRGAAIDPAERTTKSRRAVRLLVRSEDRVLLFADTDPGLPGTGWWLTPGGGMDEGETELETAARELAEETGLWLPQTAFRGPVARRVVIHGYSDQITEQSETFYLVDVEEFEVDVAGHTELEQLTIVGHKWWPIDELHTADRPVWPSNLRSLLDAEPAQWPLELGRVEESTVPVAG